MLLNQPLNFSSKGSISLKVHCFNKLLHNSFNDLRTFKFQLSQHMNNLETQLKAETVHEIDSKSALNEGNDKRLVNQSNTSGDERNMSWNECNEKSTSRDDTDIRPIYDEKPMVEDQNAAECADERAALANLIANLTLDTKENKKILKQLKKANISLTQELKDCNSKLDESNRALRESNTQDSCLIALQNKQTDMKDTKSIK
ncbi:hypothetical protein Tco_1239174 [Tanacetum coccineum]